MSRGSTGDPLSDHQLCRSLVDWFGRCARDLPWRSGRTAYAALVSEAMLQQTQVSRVVDRFNQFMKRFPDVESLAVAEQMEVLAMWQGLGYYSRARNLHRAAQVIMDRFEGVIPSCPEQLRSLPGVGRYTAGAIASIVFDRPEPIVDGNVQRVLMRLHARRGEQSGSANINWTWKRATELVGTTDDPAAFNEGLMELGATVCTRNSPSCDSCPLAAHCRSFEAGTVDSIPRPRKRAARTALHQYCVVFRRRGKLLLQQRAGTGLWANMWEVPTIESRTRISSEAIIDRFPVPLVDIERIDRFVHRTTHRDVTFHVYRGSTRQRSGHWYDIGHLDEVPLSNPQRRLIATALD